MIGCLIYYATMQPLIIITEDISTDFIQLNLAMHIISFIDIFVNFMTAYENEAGLIVINRYTIACNYLFSWFLLDFLACFPFDLILDEEKS